MLVFFVCMAVATTFEWGSVSGPAPGGVSFPTTTTYPSSTWTYAGRANGVDGIIAAGCPYNSNACVRLKAGAAATRSFSLSNTNGFGPTYPLIFTFDYRCPSGDSVTWSIEATTGALSGGVRGCPNAGKSTLASPTALNCDGAVHTIGYVSVSAIQPNFQCAEFVFGFGSLGGAVFVDRVIIGTIPELYDPYFAPLDGSKLLLQPSGGVSEAVYNVISLPKMQMNQKWVIYADHPKFKDGEWNVGTSFRFSHNNKEALVSISPEMLSSETWDACIHVEVNGEGLVSRDRVPLFANSSDYSVQFFLDCTRVIVQTPEFTFLFHARDERTLQRSATSHRWPFLQMFTSVIDIAKLKAQRPEGLLGQTVFGPHGHPTKDAHVKLFDWPVCTHCFMKGTMLDYRIEGDKLFGTRTKFARFNQN